MPTHIFTPQNYHFMPRDKALHEYYTKSTTSNAHNKKKKGLDSKDANTCPIKRIFNSKKTKTSQAISRYEKPLDTEKKHTIMKRKMRKETEAEPNPSSPHAPAMIKVKRDEEPCNATCAKLRYKKGKKKQQQNRETGKKYRRNIHNTNVSHSKIMMPLGMKDQRQRYRKKERDISNKAHQHHQ
ncbi:hypothetical protein EX30DRAFT_86242 [Ascodesmis nigricans]|uniref:Uncharacterized protein n=1 Tax=Ascodesmis nigricans TaxID=341454 RepID=A0A4S2N3A7_9PEZI|nr:hypothetical protein EX30DRAFT_86242 [Ascodesmis nigricans]